MGWERSPRLRSVRIVRGWHWQRIRKRGADEGRLVKKAKRGHWKGEGGRIERKAKAYVHQAIPRNQRWSRSAALRVFVALARCCVSSTSPTEHRYYRACRAAGACACVMPIVIPLVIAQKVWRPDCSGLWARLPDGVGWMTRPTRHGVAVACGSF